MFAAIVISLVAGILLGGYGGYRWGASVERKAAATLGSIGSKI